MLHLDKDFEPRDRWSTPESVKFINRQLARALTTSSTPEEAAMLAENLAEYLCFWLELEVENREEKLDARVDILNCKGYIHDLANPLGAKFVREVCIPRGTFPSCYSFKDTLANRLGAC